MFELQSSYSDSNYISIEQVCLCINGHPAYTGGILHVTMVAHVLCRAIDTECYSSREMEELSIIIRRDIKYRGGDVCHVLMVNNDCIFNGTAF